MNVKEIMESYLNTSRTKALILLEDEEQVKDSIKWSNELKGRKQFIALSPFAMYELDRRSIPYRIPEDYYKPEELYRLGLDNYQKVEKLCNLIDTSIHKACHILAKASINPALFSIHSLKIIYDATTIRLFQLFKLINVEKPDVIFIYDSKRYPFGNEGPFYLLFDNRESIYAQLLALPGWELPIVMLPCISKSESFNVQIEGYPTISKALKNKLVRWIMNNPTLYVSALNILKSRWGALFNTLRSNWYTHEFTPVLLFERNSWYDCLEELRSHRIGPIIQVEKHLKKRLSKPLTNEIEIKSLSSAWERLQADIEFQKFLLWRDIDFSPILKTRLEFLINRLTCICWAVYNETTDLIEEKKINALLVSDLFTCTGQSLACAARNAGIPVIGWQHGTIGYPSHLTLIYGLMGLDVYLTFGPGVNEVIKKYEESAQLSGPKLIPLGSASLATLNRKINSTSAKEIAREYQKKRVILYVTTNFYQNDSYISITPPFSDNRLWQTQRAIMNTIGNFDNHRVIIKLHPSLGYRDPPLKARAEEMGFENCQFIKNECSFPDLFLSADIVVIDFPSTTLLQSLTTSKPIFVYTGHFRIDGKAQKLLKRRAYCFEDLRAFLEALDKFLAGDDIGIKVDLNDKEFLKTYGLCLVDGKSGERAAQIVENIIG